MTDYFVHKFHLLSFPYVFLLVSSIPIFNALFFVLISLSCLVRDKSYSPFVSTNQTHQSSWPNMSP
jgi:hypothetical protein